MPPSRGATSAVANGKKTLSDSEVLAYSKNRFVEHHLRQTVQQLSDQEQACHDRLQREIVHWRHFMRQSSRTTGVWSTSLGTDADPWPGTEAVPEAEGDDPQGEDPVSRPSPRGNPSTELARSLMFQSEALSQLQKPWVYSYSEASHNTLYKDALDTARVKEKRLLFRRAASAPGIRPPAESSPPSRATSSRAASSRAGRRQQTRVTRPLTGRSTPGMTPRSAPDTPRQLTASSTVSITRRAKTSVGLVRTNQTPRKVAWMDRTETSDGSCPPNRIHRTDEEEQAELGSPEPVHVASPHVTTVFKFTEEGQSVEISTTKEKSPKEVKLPHVKRRKFGVVLSGEQLDKVAEQDICHRTLNTDTTGGCSRQGNKQLTQGTNEQMNDKQSQQTVQVESDSRAASQMNSSSTSQTVVHSQHKGQEEDSASRLQHRFAVWKLKANDHKSNANEASGLDAPPSQMTLPEGERRISPQQEVTDHMTPSPAAKEPSPPVSQPESSSKNPADDQRKSEQDDPKTNSTTSSVPRPADSRPKPPAPGQQVNGSTEQHVPGIRAVPVTHAPPKRRGSFMKIVEQLEALRAGNRRRAVRVEEEADTATDDKAADSKTDNESAANTLTDAPATDKRTRHNTVRKYAKMALAVATLKTLPEKHAADTPSSQQRDKADEDQSTDKPASNHLEDQPTSLELLPLEGGTDAALEPQYEDFTNEDGEVIFYPSSVRSVADSGYTTFRGYKIRNYVRPQQRYRADPFLSSRREKSLIRLSIEYPLYLNGNRGDLKAQMLFPKTCRQKVLQELVHRNHQPAPVQDNGVVPPELKAKIDQFFKTIDHHYPKPEVVLDQ